MGSSIDEEGVVVAVTSEEWEVLSEAAVWLEHVEAMGKKPEGDEEEARKWEERKRSWDSQYFDSKTADELRRLINAVSNLADMVEADHTRRIFNHIPLRQH